MNCGKKQLRQSEKGGEPVDIQKDDRKACGKEQTGDRDWKVTFEGGFYGQRGRRGIEIPVGY